VRGGLEIGHQPIRSGRSCTGQTGDQCLQLLRVEAIEKKMRDDQIEGLRRRRPRERIGADKINPPAARAESLPGKFKHACAGVDDGYFRIGKLMAAFAKKTAVAFAENQDIGCRWNSRQKSRPAVFSLSPASTTSIQR